MIEVKDLRKSFKSVPALRGVSFSLEKGVIGFLGPNGAGKSTTMKIISGCLAADAGTVSVCGHDILTESRLARRKIGFMPESTPLDPEMKVKDYLVYRSRLKEVPADQQKVRMSKVVEQCQIGDVLQRRISNLSKGFKQRVGLADALIHDPEILILDEPASGLDPNQIKAMRQVILDAGKDKTILLSSHVLAEVETTCQRVIVLQNGKILADDQIGNIQERLNETRQLFLVARSDPASLKLALTSVPSVEKVVLDHQGNGKIKAHIHLTSGVSSRDVELITPQIASKVIENGMDLYELGRTKKNLEDIFSSLTRIQENTKLVSKEDDE